MKSAILSRCGPKAASEPIGIIADKFSDVPAIVMLAPHLGYQARWSILVSAFRHSSLREGSLNENIWGTQ